MEIPAPKPRPGDDAEPEEEGFIDEVPFEDGDEDIDLAGDGEAEEIDLSDADADAEADETEPA